MIVNKRVANNGEVCRRTMCVYVCRKERALDICISRAQMDGVNVEIEMYEIIQKNGKRLQ